MHLPCAPRSLHRFPLLAAPLSPATLSLSSQAPAQPLALLIDTALDGCADRETRLPGVVLAALLLWSATAWSDVTPTSAPADLWGQPPADLADAPTGLWQAYAKARHAITPDGAEASALNPRNQQRFRFSATGVELLSTSRPRSLSSTATASPIAAVTSPTTIPPIGRPGSATPSSMPMVSNRAARAVSVPGNRLAAST